MSKRSLELRSRDWRKKREDRGRELSPEHLFKILSSAVGERCAIEKMVDLGIDVSNWIKAESEEV